MALVGLAHAKPVEGSCFGKTDIALYIILLLDYDIEMG